MRDVIRRNWRFWVTLAEALALTAVFAHHLEHRQNIVDQRNERQRAAICAILANIPGHIPAEIAVARQVFARPGHPGDCQPIPRPAVKQTTATPSATPAPTSTVVLVRPDPTATVTAPPSSRPVATPTKKPSPSPSPSRTCVLIVCT